MRSFTDPRSELAFTIKYLHARNLAPATSGNFSVVVEKSPLKLLMSPSSVDKGELDPEDLIEIGEAGEKISGSGKPSAETLLHLVVVKERGAGAVLHTHSVWNTLLSERFLEKEQLEISGYEILKGLSGVTTHDHVEIVPILENSQDMTRLSHVMTHALKGSPGCHAVLLSGHGMYTWGATLSEARRHAEALEFLFEVVGNKLLLEK